MAGGSSNTRTTDSSGNVQSMDLARIFVAIFMIGSLVVASPLILPVFGIVDSLFLAWAATLLPIVLMYLFMKVGKHRVEVQGSVEIEQVADSLYFMGFMFTLVALLVALIQIRSPINMSAITSKFGVAMLTTLAGLLMKVLLTQFKQEGGITQRQAQANLLRAARRFTRVLDSSSAGVEKSVNDAAARALEITEKSISEINDFVKYSQTAIADNAKSGLDLLAEKSLSDMDALFLSATSNVDALSGQAQTVIKVLAEHGKESQSKLVDDADLIARKMMEIAEANSAASDAHVSGLNAHMDALWESLSKVQARIDTLSTTLDSSVQKHRSVLGPLDRFSSNLADSNDRLSSLHGTLTSFTLTGNTLNDGVVRLEEAIKRLEVSLGTAARINSFMNLEAMGEEAMSSGIQPSGDSQVSEDEGAILRGNGTLRTTGISDESDALMDDANNHTQTEIESSSRD